MKLRDLIIQYREKHDLSQRQFASKCNLSNGYISMLENGVNPKTQKPVIPSITALQKLAEGMGLSMTELFALAEDTLINITSDDDFDVLPMLDPAARHLLEIYDVLNSEGKKKLIGYADDLDSSGRYVIK